MYGLVGVGAAAYSPAKYGILSELTSADLLVKANGLMEASTIAAILIGAVAGGTLADWNVRATLAIVAASYAAAALANLLIPRLEPLHPLESFAFGTVVKSFSAALRQRCDFCWWRGYRSRSASPAIACRPTLPPWWRWGSWWVRGWPRAS